MPTQERAAVFTLNIGTAKLLTALRKLTTCRVNRFKKRQLTYFDTFDWRLYRNDLVLFKRRLGEEKALVLTTSSGTIVSSCTIDSDPSFAGDVKKGPLRERLEKIVEVRRLFPLATVEDHGTEIAAIDGAGKTVSRLVVRSGHLRLRGKSRKALPRTLQAAPVKGYEHEHARLIGTLVETLGLVETADSDVATILQASGSSQLRSKSARTLDPAGPALRGAGQIAAELLDQLILNEEGTRRDLDPEFLHDLRVAARRTRSLLTQTRKIWPEKVLTHFLDEFKWIGGLTGPTRDLDVNLQSVLSFQGSLPEHRQNHLNDLLNLIRTLRQQEFKKLKRALTSSRFKALTAEWKRALNSTLTGSVEEGGPTLGELASRRIWKAFRRTIKKGMGLRSGTDAETLHRLRIECKKLRYLLEFFRSIFDPGSLKPVIDSLKSLQDQLGEINDLRLQGERLWGFIRLLKESQKTDPGLFLEIGRLLERIDGRRSALANGIVQCFDSFSSETNQEQLYSALFERKSGELIQ